MSNKILSGIGSQIDSQLNTLNILKTNKRKKDLTKFLPLTSLTQSTLLEILEKLSLRKRLTLFILSPHEQKELIIKEDISTLLDELMENVGKLWEFCFSIDYYTNQNNKMIGFLLSDMQEFILPILIDIVTNELSLLTFMSKQKESQLLKRPKMPPYSLHRLILNIFSSMVQYTQTNQQIELFSMAFLSTVHLYPKTFYADLFRLIWEGIVVKMESFYYTLDLETDSVLPQINYQTHLYPSILSVLLTNYPPTHELSMASHYRDRIFMRMIEKRGDLSCDLLEMISFGEEESRKRAIKFYYDLYTKSCGHFVITNTAILLDKKNEAKLDPQHQKTILHVYFPFLFPLYKENTEKKNSLMDLKATKCSVCSQRIQGFGLKCLGCHEANIHHQCFRKPRNMREQQKVNQAPDHLQKSSQTLSSHLPPVIKKPQLDKTGDGQYGQQKGVHFLTKVNFFAVSLCHICSLPIFGIFLQGKRCMKCGMICHEDCHERIRFDSRDPLNRCVANTLVPIPFKIEIETMNQKLNDYYEKPFQFIGQKISELSVDECLLWYDVIQLQIEMLIKGFQLGAYKLSNENAPTDLDAVHDLKPLFPLLVSVYESLGERLNQLNDTKKTLLFQEDVLMNISMLMKMPPSTENSEDILLKWSLNPNPSPSKKSIDMKKQQSIKDLSAIFPEDLDDSKTETFRLSDMITWLKQFMNFQLDHSCIYLLQQMLNLGYFERQDSQLDLFSYLKRKEEFMLGVVLPHPSDPCGTSAVILNVIESCLLRSENLAVHEFGLMLLQKRCRPKYYYELMTLIKQQSQSVTVTDVTLERNQMKNTKWRSHGHLLFQQLVYILIQWLLAEHHTAFTPNSSQKSVASNPSLRNVSIEPPRTPQKSIRNRAGYFTSSPHNLSPRITLTKPSKSSIAGSIRQSAELIPSEANMSLSTILTNEQEKLQHDAQGQYLEGKKKLIDFYVLPFFRNLSHYDVIFWEETILNSIFYEKFKPGYEIQISDLCFIYENISILKDFGISASFYQPAITKWMQLYMSVFPMTSIYIGPNQLSQLQCRVLCQIFGKEAMSLFMKQSTADVGEHLKNKKPKKSRLFHAQTVGVDSESSPAQTEIKLEANEMIKIISVEYEKYLEQSDFEINTENILVECPYFRWMEVVQAAGVRVPSNFIKELFVIMSYQSDSQTSLEENTTPATSMTKLAPLGHFVHLLRILWEHLCLSSRGFKGQYIFDILILALESNRERIQTIISRLKNEEQKETAEESHLLEQQRFFYFLKFIFYYILYAGGCPIELMNENSLSKLELTSKCFPQIDFSFDMLPLDTLILPLLYEKPLLVPIRKQENEDWFYSDIRLEVLQFLCLLIKSGILSTDSFHQVLEKIRVQALCCLWDFFLPEMGNKSELLLECFMFLNSFECEIREFSSGKNDLETIQLFSQCTFTRILKEIFEHENWEAAFLGLDHAFGLFCMMTPQFKDKYELELWIFGPLVSYLISCLFHEELKIATKAQCLLRSLDGFHLQFMMSCWSQYFTLMDDGLLKSKILVQMTQLNAYFPGWLILEWPTLMNLIDPKIKTGVVQNTTSMGAKSIQSFLSGSSKSAVGEEPVISSVEKPSFSSEKEGESLSADDQLVKRIEYLLKHNLRILALGFMMQMLANGIEIAPKHFLRFRLLVSQALGFGQCSVSNSETGVGRLVLGLPGFDIHNENHLAFFLAISRMAQKIFDRFHLEIEQKSETVASSEYDFGLGEGLKASKNSSIPNKNLQIPELQQQVKNTNQHHYFLFFFELLYQCIVSAELFSKMNEIVAKSWLDFVIVFIYKFELEDKQVEHKIIGLMNLLLDAVIHYELRDILIKTIFLACQILLKRNPALTTTLLSKQIIACSKMIIHYRCFKSHPCLLQAKIYLNQAFQRFGESGLFVLLFKADLKISRFDKETEMKMKESDLFYILFSILGFKTSDPKANDMLVKPVRDVLQRLLLFKDFTFDSFQRVLKNCSLYLAFVKPLIHDVSLIEDFSLFLSAIEKKDHSWKQKGQLDATCFIIFSTAFVEVFSDYTKILVDPIKHFIMSFCIKKCTFQPEALIKLLKLLQLDPSFIYIDHNISSGKETP